MAEYFLLRIYEEAKKRTDRFVLRFFNGKLETIAGRLDLSLAGFNREMYQFKATTENGDYDFEVSPGRCDCTKCPITSSVTVSPTKERDIPICSKGQVHKTPDGGYGFNTRGFA